MSAGGSSVPWQVPALLINLDRSPERLRTATAELRAAGIPFTRLPAVDGKLVDRKVRAGVAPWCKRHCTDSMLGCSLSHIRAWQLALQTGAPHTLVMEDDVKLVPDFRRRMRAVLGAVPSDCDILFLGCFGLCDQTSGQKGLARVTKYVVKALTGRQAGAVNDTVLVPLFPTGAHCYVISAKGARALAATKATFHIDAQLASTPGLKLYAAYPPLAYQTMADSTMSAFSDLTFPRTLNAVLGGVTDRHHVSAAYYMGVPGGQVLGAPITTWTGVFALLGLVRVPPAWVAAFFGVEAALGSADKHMAACVAAYAVALATRQAVKRAARGGAPTKR